MKQKNSFYLPCCLTRSFLKFLFLILSFLISFTGCIRLSGSAGYWHQGPNDEVPKTKQVGFDTQDIVAPDRPKGNITMGDQK